MSGLQDGLSIPRTWLSLLPLRLAAAAGRRRCSRQRGRGDLKRRSAGDAPSAERASAPSRGRLRLIDSAPLARMMRGGGGGGGR